MGHQLYVRLPNQELSQQEIERLKNLKDYNKELDIEMMPIEFLYYQNLKDYFTLLSPGNKIELLETSISINGHIHKKIIHPIC